MVSVVATALYLPLDGIINDPLSWSAMSLVGPNRLTVPRGSLVIIGECDGSHFFLNRSACSCLLVGLVDFTTSLLLEDQC